MKKLEKLLLSYLLYKSFQIFVILILFFSLPIIINKISDKQIFHGFQVEAGWYPPKCSSGTFTGCQRIPGTSSQEQVCGDYGYPTDPGWTAFLWGECYNICTELVSVNPNRNSYCTKPSAPTNPTSSCPVPGTTATLNWKYPNYALSYDLRVTNTTNGTTASFNQYSTTLGLTSTFPSMRVYEFSSAPSNIYNWSISACNLGGCSNYSATSPNFTCTPAPTSTPSPTSTPVPTQIISNTPVPTSPQITPTPVYGVLPIPSIAFNYGNTIPTGIPSNGLCTLQNILQTLSNLFFFLGPILALISLLYAGVRWITSGGEKQSTDLAKRMITYTIVGLVIILFAYSIMSIIGQLLGISFFQGGSGCP